MTFASPEALAVLIAGRTRELADESATKRFQSFVSEAIEYIRQTIPPLTSARQSHVISHVGKHAVAICPLNELEVSQFDAASQRR